jgi:hypothetical protein
MAIEGTRGVLLFVIVIVAVLFMWFFSNLVGEEGPRIQGFVF